MLGHCHSAQNSERNTFIWVYIPHLLMCKIQQSFILAVIANNMGTSWSFCSNFSTQIHFSVCGCCYEGKWCTWTFQSTGTWPLSSKVSLAHANQLDHPHKKKPHWLWSWFKFCISVSTLQCPTYSCRNQVIPVEFWWNPHESSHSSGIHRNSTGIPLE